MRNRKLDLMAEILDGILDTNQIVAERHPSTSGGFVRQWTIAFDGVPAVILKLSALGSRGLLGHGLQAGVAGLADEVAPIYEQYPGQMPSLDGIEAFFDPEGNAVADLQRVGPALALIWREWRSRFALQWSACPRHWMKCATAAVRLTPRDFARWQSRLHFGHSQMFAVEDGIPFKFGHYVDEFVMAVLGFGNHLPKLVDVDVDFPGWDAAHKARELCEKAENLQ